MPTFHGQTVDIHEDFEDALTSPISERDTDNNIDPLNAAAAYAGSYGMKHNLNGDTAGGEDAGIGVDLGATRDSVSWGFWFKMPVGTPTIAMDASGHVTDPASWGSYITKVYFYTLAGPAYSVRFRGATFPSPGITGLSPDTWYWLTAKSVKNGTSTLRIYDTAQTQVGSDIEITGNNTANCDALYIGTDAPGDQDINYYYDDLVIDYTDATFPLLGWDVGGETVLIQDTVGLTDVVSTVGTFFLTIADTVGITDVASVARAIKVAISDSVGIADVLSNMRELVLIITDTVGVTDTLYIDGEAIGEIDTRRRFRRRMHTFIRKHGGYM